MPWSALTSINQITQESLDSGVIWLGQSELGTEARQILLQKGACLTGSFLLNFYFDKLCFLIKLM